MTAAFVHPTADIDPEAVIGDGTRIWRWATVREGAQVGRDCTIGDHVYVDHGVRIGTGCKVQNGAVVYHGVTIGNGVFVGPNATFTNDRVPRAANKDWKVTPTTVADGATIGANATIMCGIVLGRACMVAAGAVVIRDVPPHALVAGNPARLIGWVADDGTRTPGPPGGGAA